MHVNFNTIARWERGVQAPSNLAVTTLRRVLMVPEVAERLTEELSRLAAELAAAEDAPEAEAV